MRKRFSNDGELQLKRVCKEAFFWLMSGSPVPWRELSGLRNRQRVVVLMYHV